MIIGKKLLQLTDTFVENKDITSLKTLSAIITELILNHAQDTSISLIEINEYIGEAIAHLEMGSSLDDIKNLAVRQLIVDDK